MSSQYEKLGIDPNKENVRQIAQRVIDNDFPGAFVPIVYDPEDSRRVLAFHFDGDGSKFIQRVLNNRESRVESTKNNFAGAADDALSMNTGDLVAAGLVRGPILFGDIFDLNPFKVNKDDALRALVTRLGELREIYRSHGFTIYFMGGETADLPHQIRTAVLNVGVHVRGWARDVIRGNVVPGDKIWGFGSDGQARWETTPNSGIMANGLTHARVTLMHADYTTKHPDLIEDGAYRGRFLCDDSPPVLGGMTVGEALISPTRQWAIVIKILIDKLKEKRLLRHLHGITMNTGGGATKVLHLGQGGIIFQKSMPLPPPIFRLIKSESREEWVNMFRTYNAGIGIDIIGNERIEGALREVEEETGVVLHRLGQCLRYQGSVNRVELDTPFGHFIY